MPPSLLKTRAEKSGHRAEALAALWLRAQFYRIRHKRFKTPVGEIDLIAERSGKIIFVEVKARKSAQGFANALQAVNTRRIIRAAEYFLAKNPHLAERDMQFDVIFLAPMRLPRHLRDAFQAA